MIQARLDTLFKRPGDEHPQDPLDWVSTPEHVVCLGSLLVAFNQMQAWSFMYFLPRYVSHY